MSSTGEGSGLGEGGGSGGGSRRGSSKPPTDLTISLTLQEEEINEAMRIIIQTFGDHFCLTLDDLRKPREPRGVEEWVHYLEWLQSPFTDKIQNVTSNQRENLKRLIRNIRFVNGSLPWAEVAAEIPDPVSSRLRSGERSARNLQMFREDIQSRSEAVHRFVDIQSTLFAKKPVKPSEESHTAEEIYNTLRRKFDPKTIEIIARKVLEFNEQDGQSGRVQPPDEHPHAALKRSRPDGSGGGGAAAPA